ncbi:MAG: DNA polymerase III subunit beta [Parachlamydiales bacterium]|nr:DNA polymerase III subunit beta [Parachlamydiales bacterium]
MKFVIAKNDLMSVIGKLQNVVPTKPTLPILANVLVEAINNEIIFTVTDLTVGMRCYVPAKVIEEGSTTLPARRFFQLVKELTTANIEITTNANEITEITAGSSRFKLNGMRKNDFPGLPDLAGAHQVKVKQSTLKEMLFKTSFAVSREDTRYVLTGVLLRLEQEGRATFVGTDGKRLAKAEAPVPAAQEGDYIIPLKAVDEVVKLLTEDQVATLYFMKDKIAVEANQTIVITKLLSGDYPNYQRVIPSQCDINVTLHREELMTLLRQISLFTPDASHSVKFIFVPGELILTANSIDIGEGKVSMPANYGGTQMQVAFNPNFFLDILRHSSDETVNLGLTDGFNPGLVTDSSGALCVIMPMRLKEE